MSMRRPRFGLAAALVVAVMAMAGCGEKPQKAESKVVGTPVWKGTNNGFMAPNWKAGDKTSWEDQMRARAQAQNEYTRTGLKP